MPGPWQCSMHLQRCHELFLKVCWSCLAATDRAARLDQLAGDAWQQAMHQERQGGGGGTRGHASCGVGGAVEGQGASRAAAPPAGRQGDGWDLPSLPDIPARDSLLQGK